MSAAGTFACEGCRKNYAWKPALAGKRVKCKCGQIMSVPKEVAPPAQEEDMDALYSLASQEQEAAKHQKPVIVASAPAAAAASGPKKTSTSKSGVPLAYQKPISARDKAAASDALFDKNRDLYAPLVLILVGFVLYLSYYAVRAELSASGMMAVTVGLTVLTIFETVLLVGFALTVAGPLGVGFGSVGPAILKLAAVAVFCDGVTSWVDAFIAKYSGGFGAGIFGYGAIGLPIALGIYWGLLIYLFSMDPGDSWMVVVILAIFYRIIRVLLLVLLLQFILSFGSPGAKAIATIGASAAPPDSQSAYVSDLQDRKMLEEARAYIAGGSKVGMTKYVEQWHDAGCPNMWFEVSRDINGHEYPQQLIVELPKQPAQRVKCYDTLNLYFKDAGSPLSTPTKDTGEKYMMVPLL